MTMKNIIKLAAVGLLALAPSSAFAGKGGSAAAIQAAMASGSSDAIAAELERTESLICDECVALVTALTEDSRYPVREVAAWWFGRRPALRDMLVGGFVADLPRGDTIAVRNAADFLGRTMSYTALPNLRAAIKRDVGPEAKLAIVRAVHYLGHRGGNEALTVAMADRDATVRAEAARAWRDIFDQVDAGPVVALLGDSDATVRSEAATVVGAMKTLAGRGALEALVVNDASPIVRRNAAWALGKLGQSASRDALTKASNDPSGLVQMTAKAALGQLH
jgi:HEAT repeat protein